MWRSTVMASALGIEIALCFGVGGGTGYFLDRKFNTHWIMYLGLLFGLGAAIKGIVRVTKAYRRDVAGDDRRTGNGGGDGGQSN
jgi:F0F1-type ATP synthase assembly protein I